MRNIIWIYPAIALLAITLSDSAPAHGWHRHGHLNLGINLGGYGSYYGPGFYGYGNYGFGGYGFGGYGFGGYGYGYPSYYPPPYVYLPTVVMVPTTPPVYTEQQQAQPAQPQTGYWHYCQNPQGYYPYVKNCPGGWLQVSPSPPTQ